MHIVFSVTKDLETRGEIQFNHELSKDGENHKLGDVRTSVKHEEGKLKRAEMRGGSHIQGSIPLSLHTGRDAVLQKGISAITSAMKPTSFVGY